MLFNNPIYAFKPKYEVSSIEKRVTKNIISAAVLGPKSPKLVT